MNTQNAGAAFLFSNGMYVRRRRGETPRMLARYYCLACWHGILVLCVFLFSHGISVRRWRGGTRAMLSRYSVSVYIGSLFRVLARYSRLVAGTHPECWRSILVQCVGTVFLFSGSIYVRRRRRGTPRMLARYSCVVIGTVILSSDGTSLSMACCIIRFWQPGQCRAPSRKSGQLGRLPRPTLPQEPRGCGQAGAGPGARTGGQPDRPARLNISTMAEAQQFNI